LALDPLIKELGNEKFMEEGKRLFDRIVLGQKPQSNQIHPENHLPK